MYAVLNATDFNVEIDPIDLIIEPSVEESPPGPLSNVSLALFIIGASYISAIMFASLCCSFMWIQKVRGGRRNQRYRKEAAVDLPSEFPHVTKSIPKTRSQPIVRSSDIIAFVLPTHQGNQLKGKLGGKKLDLADNDEADNNNSLAVSCNYNNRTNSGIKPGSLQRDLYLPGKGADEEEPKIGISLQYNAISQDLYVKVIGALSLPSRNRGGLPDPYVKITLLPEKAVKFTTRTLRATCSPLYNEIFHFLVPQEKLVQTVIRLTVKDRSDHGDHFIPTSGHSGMPKVSLGRALIALNQPDLVDLTNSDAKRKVTWCLLEKTRSKIPVLPSSNKGELLVTLSFGLDLGLLTIEVIAARNLDLADHTERDKLYVKLILYEQQQVIALRRTRGVRCSSKNCAEFQQRFDFLLPPLGILETSCQIMLCTRNKLGVKKTLGRVALGNRYFDNSYLAPSYIGMDQWHDMAHRPGLAIRRWQPLL